MIVVRCDPPPPDAASGVQPCVACLDMPPPRTLSNDLQLASTRRDRSLGSVGDYFDNAVVESFWARMQVELLNRQRWRTRIELANAIFEYLEIFHNRQRRHSALGMRTPIEYERIHYDNQPLALQNQS